MGMGTTIIIILVVANILFYIPCLSSESENFCYMSGLTILLKFITGVPSTGQLSISPWFIGIVTGIAIGAAIVTGVFGASLSGLSLAAAGASLLTLATFPVTLLQQTGTPYEIKLLVGGVFSVMYILAVLSFMRGSEF